MHHHWQIWFGSDADYMIYVSLQDGRWVEHMRCMLPGTYLEDAN